ncbi:cytokinin riboside 5 -monophosphate phosphoribohydrolase LOG3-like [Micractinium conductrix]|uniref:cytokinin riboside 5'-monophosphate phosphoribohydrolase n=1 Tax=Micractinium conductrix TaxID=554055 RepID=A0A2P6VHA6_9CHLO|nr:cytokinin riboside 5 -monophosphate phosphoribohydrolase LOG3-like [Micractinium conductrix]|eukprot:PSC73469.1 cytokinin riboside 5 -monophosphate phosphoribohydrolase LOG3-like [Micractinium conductrix]
MLHRCGRNAEDFWPPSAACPQCIGMPEGVSIAKQALARGYALLAINSADRRVGPATRCWSWGPDAVAVRDIARAFREEHRLAQLPLFFTGCSSGGSLALRLPGLMEIDGVMPVAIGLDLAAFPLTDPKLKFPYPPLALVHFAKDANTMGKVAGMLGEMEKRGVPGADAQVVPFAITPDFFSRRNDMVSLRVSQELHAALQGLGVLNATGHFAEDKVPADQPPPWDAVLRDQLPRWLEAARAEQLALKNRTTLALALGAAGDPPLSIQEVAADAQAGADAAAADEDWNPNFSDSDGLSSASGGKDPYLSARVLEQQIKEEIAVAWASHTNLGDYTAAALEWLEHCGRPSFYNLQQRLAAQEPAALSPPPTGVAVAASTVTEEWLQATGVPLLNAMQQCASLSQAAVLAVQVAGTVVVGTLAGRALLRFLDKQVSRSRVAQASPGALSSMGEASWSARALLSSLLHQAQASLGGGALGMLCQRGFLPPSMRAQSSRHVSLGPVAPAGRHAGRGRRGRRALRHVTQFMQDEAEEVVLLLIAFTLLEFKNRLVAHVQGWLMADDDRTNDDVVGLVGAAGTFASALIWGGCAVVTLANYGVNLRPLLASLGASSLVVGIAAQSMLRNLAAGITLYATRPFSLGDRVVLWSVGGMCVVEGYIAAVHPTRTVIAKELPGHGTDGMLASAAPVSFFFVNNGDIVESMIVENKSRAPPTPLGVGPASARAAMAGSSDAAPEAAPRQIKKIAVFCGASSGTSPEYVAAAKALGEEMARRGIGLVYGGGNVGLMGAVAEAVGAGLGPEAVLGVIPAALEPREISGTTVGEIRVVKTMHERKAMMFEEADAFVTIPGGFGTLDETLEITTWQQLGFHAKPVGVLNVRGFFDGLLAFLDHATSEGFIRPASRAILIAANTPRELIDALAAYQPPPSLITLASQGALGLHMRGSWLPPTMCRGGLLKPSFAPANLLSVAECQEWDELAGWLLEAEDSEWSDEPSGCAALPPLATAAAACGPAASDASRLFAAASPSRGAPAHPGSCSAFPSNGSAGCGSGVHKRGAEVPACELHAASRAWPLAATVSRHRY